MPFNVTRPYRALLPLAWITLSPTGLEAQAPADSAAVAATVGEFHRALAQSDSAAVLTLLAPDATIMESGGIESRQEYRQHHLPADIAFARAVPSVIGGLSVVMQGDVAWVTSTSRSTGTFKGRKVDSRGAELMILSRSAEGWQIRAIHWSSH